MRKINIGKSGISVTELCHGTLILGWLQANLTPTEGAKVIQRSLELGVNFYDTAQGYRTYAHLAAGIHGVPRKNVVIASKSHSHSYDAMKVDVGECLSGLSLDYIDIFELHQVQSVEDLNKRRGALNCLVELRDSGIVKIIGASTHTVAGVKALNSDPMIEVIFPVLNKYGLGIIDGTLTGMLDALSEAKESGKFVYAMKPLGGGHLAEDAENCFTYLRELPQCDAIAVGMKDEAEVEMNVALFDNKTITEDLRNQVHAIERHLKIYDRCTGCGLCINECDQGALSLADDQAIVDQSKCILCGYCAAVCPEYVIRIV